MKDEGEPLSHQLIDDYDKMLQENDHMSKSNAIKNLVLDWNMPYSVIKEIIDNR